MTAFSARRPELAAAESVLEAIWCGTAREAFDAVLSLPETDWQRVLATAVAPF